ADRRRGDPHRCRAAQPARLHHRAHRGLRLSQVRISETHEPGSDMTSWLLTGPTQAFGPELIRQLLACGDRVAAITDRPEDVAAVNREYGGAVWVRAVTGHNIDQLREAVSAAFTELGRIEVVVSNARYGLVGAAEEFTDADVVALITTNLTGAIRLARTVVPHLRAQGGGHIVQVSSMAGQT